jgi:hypothetical protein
MIEKTKGTNKNGQYRETDNIGNKDKDKQMLENTEGAIKNGQYRETDNIGYTRQRQTNVREYQRGNQKWTIQRN